MAANQVWSKDFMFDRSAEGCSTKNLSIIAADHKHLGAAVGAALVLHAWGSVIAHHPHVHGNPFVQVATQAIDVQSRYFTWYGLACYTSVRALSPPTHSQLRGK
jgi:hypothetical protein